MPLIVERIAILLLSVPPLVKKIEEGFTDKCRAIDFLAISTAIRLARPTE
jgi:hypothetical protein